jgi:hypothetical protein
MFTDGREQEDIWENIFESKIQLKPWMLRVFYLFKAEEFHKALTAGSHCGNFHDVKHMTEKCWW